MRSARRRTPRSWVGALCKVNTRRLNSASRSTRSSISKPSRTPAVAASTRVSATVRGVRGAGASGSGALPRPRPPLRPRRPAPAQWPRRGAASTRSDTAGGTSSPKLAKSLAAASSSALRVGGGRGVKRSRIGIGSCNRHGLGYPRAERVRVAVERSSESQAAEELQTHFLRARGDVTVGAREVPDDQAKVHICTGGQRLGSVNECTGDRDPVPACGIV